MKRLLFALLVLCTELCAGQTLKPGFDADEYMEVLQRCAAQVGRQIYPQTAKPLSYKRAYTSLEIGLHNRWELWLSGDSRIMAINLRGTTGSTDNWLENLYAAMIPANGSLKLNDTTTFNYKFAADPLATVHVGWTVGICSMLPDILAHIKENYAKGTKQIIVEGHSQGGALALLLSAYLHYQVADGMLPADIVIKTYASAPPKPGNNFFANDFDYNNREGWGYSVFSSIDWVPESPFALQQVGDFNNVNPFRSIKPAMRKQHFFVRLYAGHIYNKLTHATRKAQRRYEKYMGRKAYKYVRRYLPEFEQPVYTHSMNYVRAGVPIVLVPDDAYYKQFAGMKENVFMHHLFDQYYFLVKRIYKHEGVN
jgi:pimeloyl-ACP methyl ester carboxylesterase